MEFDTTTLATPAVIAILITLARQATDKLDGPAAYWFAIVGNIVAQVLLAVTTGDGTTTATAALVNGAIGGAVISPGIVTGAKRVGMGAIVKPKRDQ